MLQENLPLDSSKQKQFVKSIKGIKRLLKKNKDAQPKLDDKQDSKYQDSKDKKIKKKSKERGLVYLSHIPHGFYEHEMTQYFKQFGVVTNARVIRSKRTGNSKGHAFVEFKEPTVAKIVAETMNNYLMGKRLIKASIIPPEEQRRHAFRKRWNSINNPGHNHRLKMKKAYNATKDDKGELKRATKLLANLSRTKEKLSELGINYDFFKPVDVPQSLLTTVVKKEKEESDEDNNIKHESPNKKDPEDQKPKVTQNKKEETKKQLEKDNNIAKKEFKSSVKVDQINSGKSKVGQKNNSNKKNLSKTDMKQLEHFTKLELDKDTSDSAYEFDSDEYEKVIQSDDDSNLSLSDESEEETAAVDVVSDDKQSDKVTSRYPKQKTSPTKKSSKNEKQNVYQKNKRKVTQKGTMPPKKLKMEKARAPLKVNKLIKKKK